MKIKCFLSSAVMALLGSIAIAQEVDISNSEITTTDSKTIKVTNIQTENGTFCAEIEWDTLANVRVMNIGTGEADCSSDGSDGSDGSGIQFSPVGRWSLGWSWSCDGSYSRVGIEFFDDGTIHTYNGGGRTAKGEWYHTSSGIGWNPSLGSSVYEGVVKDDSYMSGNMNINNGSNGCWEAIRE